MAGATQARVDGVPVDMREAMKTEASAAARRSDTLKRIGLGVAIASAASLFVSIHKRESRWNSVPVVVLLAYIIWFLVLV